LSLAASVFSQSREGIIITNTQGTIIEVNNAFTYITGYSHEEALGQNPRFLKSDRHEPEVYVEMWQALTSKGHWYGELWNRRKNGEEYAELINISAVKDSQSQAQNYIALFSDITSAKEHQQQMEHAAHFDALTGLPNRLLLSDRLEQAVAQTQRRNCTLAVVYLDLDGFKEVNDQWGHQVGDCLLQDVAQRMVRALRKTDT
jgi:PAS domain S-box-containing protein